MYKWDCSAPVSRPYSLAAGINGWRTPHAFMPYFHKLFFSPHLYGSAELNQSRSAVLPSLARVLHAQGQLYGIFFPLSNRISLALKSQNSVGFLKMGFAQLQTHVAQSTSWNVITQKSTSPESKVSLQRLVRFLSSWLTWKSTTLKILSPLSDVKTVLDAFINHFHFTDIFPKKGILKKMKLFTRTSTFRCDEFLTWQ